MSEQAMGQQALTQLLRQYIELKLTQMFVSEFQAFCRAASLQDGADFKKLASQFPNPFTATGAAVTNFLDAVRHLIEQDPRQPGLRVDEVLQTLHSQLKLRVDATDNSIEQYIVALGLGDQETNQLYRLLTGNTILDIHGGRSRLKAGSVTSGLSIGDQYLVENQLQRLAGIYQGSVKDYVQIIHAAVRLAENLPEIAANIGKRRKNSSPSNAVGEANSLVWYERDHQGFGGKFSQASSDQTTEQLNRSLSKFIGILSERMRSHVEPQADDADIGFRPGSGG